MNRRAVLQSVAVLALVGVAAYLLLRQLRAPAPGELGFFYDASAKRIFTGPRDAPPPIRGVDGPGEDGYRAVVISLSGKPADRKSWEVAYLEKFSPELQRLTREAQNSAGTLAMGRLESQAHRFVRRVEDAEWHALNTSEAETILNGWTTRGANGVTPAVCTP